METAKEFYDRLRKTGWTDDITSNPEPNYNEPFYQNIFRLMEGYARLCEGNQTNSKPADCAIFDVSPRLFYVVAYITEDDLEQITNGLTYERAKAYRDGDFCKSKWPNAFIMATLNEG